MWHLVVMSISRLLVFKWVLIVPHWWHICSYIHMKLILYIKKQKTSSNLTFRYVDDVLSLNNPKFNDYVDVIYPKELEIKDTKEIKVYIFSKMG